MEEIKEDSKKIENEKEKYTEKEFNEDLNFLKNHPLFMKEMPKEIEKNEAINALQNLMYNDTPENIAKACNVLIISILFFQKDRGNNLIKKEGLYFKKEAFKAYSDGILHNCKDQIINSKLYSNRSLLNLQFSN